MRIRWVIVAWDQVPGVEENIGGGRGARGRVVVKGGVPEGKLRVIGMSLGGGGDDEEDCLVFCCCCWGWRISSFVMLKLF